MNDTKRVRGGEGKKANDAHGGEAINIMSVHRHVVSNVESLAKRDGS